MTLNVERLLKAKGDIADLSRVVKSRGAADISDEARRLLADFANLDGVTWDFLLAKLDDLELREQLESIRRSLGTQIRSVRHATSFDLARQSLKILLNMKAGENSLESNQDLEDTLWIGAAVVEVVSDSMLAMERTLHLEAQRNCVGTVFEENLMKAEKALREVRRIYMAASGAGGPDVEGDTTA